MPPDLNPTAFLPGDGVSPDERWMYRALREAQLAYEEDEVPIGAIIVAGDRIIARGHNQTERLKDCTAHAEMIALTAAFNSMGSKYLAGASLYVTIEPCLMCAGAIYWSRIGRLVFGAGDEKNGYKRIARNNSPFHPGTTIVSGILEDDCKQLMQDFFRHRRK